MNRQIKFRVWHKIKNKMYQTEEIDTIENQMDDKFDYCVNLIYTDSPNCIPESMGEIMQFTGLKDTCDKDIYEGDILEERISEHETNLYKVEWGGDGWFLVQVSDAWDINDATSLEPEMQPRMSYFYYNMKVVGNIFENKNLLTPTITT